MSDPLRDWLEDWGQWLDALLATGLACPTREARQRIARWSEEAELLGFLDQRQAALRLLEEGIAMAERARIFFALLQEQDMLMRLHEARQLRDRAEALAEPLV